MGRRAAKIAGRKEKQDAAKTKLYGKFGKMIVSAAKEGGVDVIANQNLAKLIRDAQVAKVPKDIIDRNLKRASESKQADYQNVMYEAYGIGGTGIVIEGLTDNVNRAAAEIRAAVNKGGGKMAVKGSVLFNFKKLGVLMIAQKDISEDKIVEIAIDSGADDVIPKMSEEEGGDAYYKVVTEPDDWGSVRDALIAADITIEADQSGLVYEPLTLASDDDDELINSNEKLVDRLLELEDVDAVYTQLPE